MTTIKEKSKQYNLHSWSVQGTLNPKVITRASGIYMWDDEGKRYADMSSQLVNLNLGHGNRALIEAIKEQAEKLAYIAPNFAADVRSDAAEALVKMSRMKNAKVFFTNAGAEANENAIKIAKAYTGKWKIFSMYRSYHGSSAGAGMLTGEPRHFANEPGAPGFIKFDGPYPYRAPGACKFTGEEDIANFYLELLENQIKYEDPASIAAIWLETIVGSNGIHIPPKGYLEGVRALCDKYQILLVCDEVMSGFYRTGEAFAFHHFDFMPDMFTFAKGSTCGYVPLGGVIVGEHIQKIFDNKKLLCGLTYSAHPLGCAVALAAVKEYERLAIAAHVKKQGKVLAELLNHLAEKHLCVGEVRSIGLFSCVELVKNKKTREPLVPFNGDKEGIMARIVGMLVNEGFYTYSHENFVFVNPPLIITEEELRENLGILDKILGAVDEMVYKKVPAESLRALRN